MINEMRKDEAFKKWCFDTKLVGNKNWFNLENGSGDEVYIAYEAWLASASRDGYKLVPLEPTKAMMQAVVDEVKKSGHLADFYKAMIGASE